MNCLGMIEHFVGLVLKVLRDVRFSSILDPQLQAEGSYELGSVRPSVRHLVRLSFCPDVFLGLAHQFFLKLGMVLGTHVLLCMIELDFFFNFCPKNWGNGPKMPQKQFFFDLLENLVINFFGIWSIKEVHIVCCILALILYLEKIWFLRSVPKCSQSIGLQDI